MDEEQYRGEFIDEDRFNTFNTYSADEVVAALTMAVKRWLSSTEAELHRTNLALAQECLKLDLMKVFKCLLDEDASMPYYSSGIKITTPTIELAVVAEGAKKLVLPILCFSHGRADTKFMEESVSITIAKYRGVMTEPQLLGNQPSATLN